MKWTQLLFALLLLIASCTHEDTNLRETFSHSEKIIDQYPDSVVVLLENIKNPMQLSAADYAHWGLLLIQSRDKAYLEHTSDTLINKIVAYYENKGDDYQKALSLYYQGRVYSDLRRQENAISSYLIAWENAIKTIEYGLQARIQNHLGSLYYDNSLYENALYAYENAERAYRLAKDTVGVASVLRDTGWNYMSLDKPDSSYVYLMAAERIARTTQDSLLLASALISLGNYYKEIGRIPDAVSYMQEARAYTMKESQLPSLDLSLGVLYKKSNKADSACICLNKSLKSSNLYVKCQTNRELYLLMYEQKKYDLAYQYNENYLVLLDSIEAVYQPEKIAKMEALYQKEVLINEHNQLLLAKQHTIIYILIVSATVFILLSIFIYLYQTRLHRREKELEEKKNLLVNYGREIKTAKTKIEEYETLLRLKQEEIEQQDKLGIENNFLREDFEKQKAQLEKFYHGKQILIKGYIENDKLLAGLLDKNEIVCEYDARKWTQFEHSFSQIYPTFIERLQKTYPAISEMECQICCLVKLEVKSAKIAAMLGKEPNTVSKYKKQILEKYFKENIVANLRDALISWE